MIAFDTNILVYAHRSDSPFHQKAKAELEACFAGAADWAVPWSCWHEFYDVVTHPKIYRPPSTPAEAFAFMDRCMSAPNLRMIGEGPGYEVLLKSLVFPAHIKGPKVHDARIASVCIYHGVKTLFTADRDFSAFPKLRCENPLV